MVLLGSLPYVSINIMPFPKGYTATRARVRRAPMSGSGILNTLGTRSASGHQTVTALLNHCLFFLLPTLHHHIEYFLDFTELKDGI